MDHIEEDTIVRVGLHLSSDGRQLEHTYWLNRQSSVNAFLAEMAALGFPASSWGSGPGKVALSEAIPWCVARLKGLRFHANKTSRHVEAQPGGMGKPAREAKTYHDLRIQTRITGRPQPGPREPAQPQAPRRASSPSPSRPSARTSPLTAPSF